MEGLAEKIVIGVIIAVTSAWVTVRLSLSKYRTEKWWDRKIEAYTNVIEAFHHSKAFSDKHLGAEWRGRELDPDIDKEIRAKVKLAHGEIEKYINIGSFIFSNEFYTRLKEYQRESERISNESHGWVDYLVNDQEHMESCISDLIVLAQKDLSK